ncbi:NAD(P)H-dependent oxidoreductase [Sebaldella sp. S0638]|uniref:NAD(P)H-dependent oxidoreductase n=1 Tax=Sebaldella sp. S0638 TaxID=2957809 RepID=UPI00209CB22E|nr:NAD(P)H-dependent oxidoreductase [Sebaldella sp. S0638]MCP1225374.1 NAD(P)H-dependent oxidoreductase [Sebaldella sp. S0638]
MNYLIVYAHPNKLSFNHALKETAVKFLTERGCNVEIRDLYEISFNPVLSSSDFITFSEGKVPDDIKKEQDYITKADKIIFISPIWWTSFPAILKGYFDRIFSYGFAYLYENHEARGLLNGKEALFISTTSTPYDIYKVRGYHDSLEMLQDEGILKFSGFKTLEHLFFGDVPFVTDIERKEYLLELERVLEKF